MLTGLMRDHSLLYQIVSSPQRGYATLEEFASSDLSCSSDIFVTEPAQSVRSGLCTSKQPYRLQAFVRDNQKADYNTSASLPLSSFSLQFANSQLSDYTVQLLYRSERLLNLHKSHTSTITFIIKISSITRYSQDVTHRCLARTSIRLHHLSRQSSNCNLPEGPSQPVRRQKGTKWPRHLATSPTRAFGGLSHPSADPR